jgi:hypothetical protein
VSSEDCIDDDGRKKLDSDVGSLDTLHSCFQDVSIEWN